MIRQKKHHKDEPRRIDNLGEKTPIRHTVGVLVTCSCPTHGCFSSAFPTTPLSISPELH